jgi:hypothetical protein
VLVRAIGDSKIEFSVVPQKVDYLRLKGITHVEPFKDENDSLLNYYINPTIRELKVMIRSGLFNRSEVYVKQKVIY